jgi:formylglycine-generating enzyme required for sulfatase activity
MKKLLLLVTLTTLLNAEQITNSVGITFVKIPKGSFTMGTQTPHCPKDDPFTEKNEYDACLESISKDETPAHTKRVESFYLATTEVTQLQYHKVMGENPSHFKREKLGYDSRHNPVEKVSWHDAKRFIAKLNKLENTNAYYLPSEIEWEYAARARSSTKWHFGNSESSLSDYAWYDKNAYNMGEGRRGYGTHPVAKKKPNRWGLYDMHGNVYEWTSSCYTKRYKQSGCYRYSDGTIPKVQRGGCWVNSAGNTRSAYRSSSSPSVRSSDIGFRVAKK